LIAGPAVYICDECIQLCSESSKKKTENSQKQVKQILAPKQIKEMLDEYVIEQDRAKKYCLSRYTITINDLNPQSPQEMWKFKKAISC
jgi:ATP-dependent protease Clp ATPase subunit